MYHKKIIFIAFILVAIAQLLVPAKMIFDQERILSSGKLFKFKTAPIDPTDPFRGKYIVLRYDETEFIVYNDTTWLNNQDAFVSLDKDLEGYAYITGVFHEKPEGVNDYVKAKLNYVTPIGIDSNKLFIEYSFNRFYMEESKAYDAEMVYNESVRDTIPHTSYALVSVKDGEAVLKDVLIDERSIKDIVKERLKNKEAN